MVEKAGLMTVRPLPGLFFRCTGVVAGMIVLGVFAVKPAEMRAVEPRAALLLALGGFLASIVGQFFFYNALRLGEVSRLAPIAGSYPFFTFLLGVLFLGESASLVKIAGVMAIVGGVWLLKIG
jgi:transporter family protein